MDDSTDTNRFAAEARIDNALASDGKTIAEHSDNPNDPTDTSVKHVDSPETLQKSGVGFPAGEYDITKPTLAPAKEQTAVEAHLATVDTDALKDLMKDTVLDPEEYALVLEATQVGFELVHEGPSRWRAKQNQRYGHGRTAKEAIEAFVLGTSSLTLVDAAALEFSKMSSTQQQEIRDRDAAAQGVTGAPGFAVEESRKTAEKRKGAALPSIGARTDAAEQMSASQTQQSGAPAVDVTHSEADWAAK